MVVKFRNTSWPPPPQLSSNSNRTWSVYNRENPKSSLYCEMSVAGIHVNFDAAPVLRGNFGAAPAPGKNMKQFRLPVI
jgi:hypothetical protein